MQSKNLLNLIKKVLLFWILVEAKAKSGNTKSAKTVLNNLNYKINNLLKLTSQNIGIVDNKFTAPYYFAFYILNKYI